MARSPDSLPPPPVAEPTPALADEGLDPTAVRDPLLGMELGEYRITRRLGEGGMGVVYAAIQPVIQKPVAIKILQNEAGQAGEEERLKAEARAANAVRHRGIVDVFAFGKMPDGRPYIVMDLLQGEPLDAILEREAPLNLDRALSILDDVLDTLSAAHAAGVVHRDLKPANMFLVRQANGEAYVRILDFGLAKRSGPGGPRTSRASMVAGTPHYMAPEQALGETVGPRADLYSVGCIAYEMLTGRLPFDTEDPVEQIAKRLSTVPVRASKVARVPAELDEIVMRLLEREPEDRPASAAIVRQQISKYRRILQSESTVMGPRPVAQPVVAAEPEPEPGMEDPTVPGRVTFTPVPAAQRDTARTEKPRSLAVGLAVVGVVALVGVALAAVLVPRSQTADQEIPDPPAAADEPEPEPPPLPKIVGPAPTEPTEPADPPKASDPPKLVEPQPTPAPKPEAPAAEPKPKPEPRPAEPKAQVRPKPEAKPKAATPAADPLEGKRKEVSALLAKVWAIPDLTIAERNLVATFRDEVPATARVEDLAGIEADLRGFLAKHQK